MSKLLLIDGSNLCHRVFWANRELSFEGSPVGAIYGFFKSLISLRKKYPEHFMIIAWDSRSKRRMEESTKAVENGLIPFAYKENRKDRNEEISEELESLFAQMDTIREGLKLVKILQVRMSGYEADDVIYTYVNQNKGNENVVITSDKDYYQMLYANVKVIDAMKQETWTEERFEMEYGFSPDKWVEVGSLCGDTSDGIHGIAGWGEKTAIKYIIKHGNRDNVIQAIKEESERLDSEYATKVAKAEEKGKKPPKKKELKKKEQCLLDSLEIIELANSLKQMDIVPFVPRIRLVDSYDHKNLEEYFLKYNFGSLLKDVRFLV